MNKSKLREQKNNETKLKKSKIEKIDIAIFLIVFIIFGFALLSFYPGIITSDCFDQINQASENAYRTGHPIIHSFIIGNLAKIVDNIWLPALLQIVVFALVWTYACKSIRKYNDSRKNKFWQIFITLIICILPLNYMYSITLWKDILYGYMFFLLVIMIYVGIKEKFKYTTFQTILISLSAVSVMKFRYNGAPIGAIMFFIIVLLNFKYNKKINDTIKLIISFALIMIAMCIPQWTVNILTSPVSGGSVLNSTKVYCMGALFKNANVDKELTDDEREFLDSILDVKEWKDCYDPYFGSYIFYNHDYNNYILTTPEANEKMSKIFNKYASEHKGVIIQHFISVNSIWWQISEKSFMNSVVLENDTEFSKYENHPILTSGNKVLSEWCKKTLSSKNIYYLTYRPATALYISIVLTIAIIIRERKNKNHFQYLLLILPMILNIGTFILLISSQDQRYFYPNCMTEYALLLIFAGEFFKYHENAKACDVDENFNEKLKEKKYPKVLVIIPAYNEEKSIEGVVNRVYSQNIKNLDVIVVNDGSKDNTPIEAKKTKAFVVDSPNNLGIGGAVQTGYLYAYQNNYDIAIQIDGDGQHDPAYLNKMIDEVKNGTDMVIGSRFIKKSGYDQTFMRMLGIRMISSVIKNITNKKIYDTTSGYRAVNNNIIKEFVLQYPYDYPEPCTTMNMIKKGYSVKEIPVEMKKREQGKSSISPLKSISYMFKVFLYLVIRGIFD